MLDRLDATHWRITDDSNQEVAQLLDLGTEVVIHEPRDLTPDNAYELARALITWAGEKKAKRRQAIRDANELGPEVIVRDDGSWIEPDRKRP